VIAIAVHDWLRGDGKLCRIILGAPSLVLRPLYPTIFSAAVCFFEAVGTQFRGPRPALVQSVSAFGAMILGTTDSTSPDANVLGWVYHFSNGITFGVMYAI